MWALRVVIPDKLQECVLDKLHTAHPGIVRMKELAQSYVYWPDIDADIERLARSCTGCQQVKALPSVAPRIPWIWPRLPWQRIHVDYTEFNGQNFLVVIDAHSK